MVSYAVPNHQDWISDWNSGCLELSDWGFSAESHQVSFDLLPQDVELGQAQLPAPVRLSYEVQEHSGF